jgi:hypothetical protein
VAPADATLAERINEVRTALSKNYQPEQKLNTKPHLLISDFVAKDEMEDTIIRWMQRILGEQKSFTTTLRNYTGFAPDSLLLPVEDTEPFRQLASRLEPIDFYIRSNACPAARFHTHPFISLARRLPSTIYEKAIREYDTKEFCATFLVKQLVLLRRQDPYDTCKQIAVFQLNPMKDLIPN